MEQVDKKQVNGRGDFAGSILMAPASTTELTDAAATCVFTIDDVRRCGSILVDVISDKDCTVDIVRYLDPDQSFEGAPASQGVVTGGTPGQFKYSDLGCYAVKVTITKTEAGTSSGFFASVRGQAD